MKQQILLLLFTFFSVAQLTFATSESPANASPEGGSVVGKVVDSNTKQPVEYANVALYSLPDSILITGGITDEEGKFSIKKIKSGKYYATIKFIGYNETFKEDIIITRDNKVAKLGMIQLKEASQNLNQVNVVADKQQVLYKIDKKIVNPSQFIAAQGGSAIDILANTPSVSVDIEGNVTMRGSSNFLVLVNGKPTPFDATDALAQIPAASIENIEIITNPSAKYDPDGAAGILNIITKKNAQLGWNGMVNANANTLGTYGGDFLFNFTGDKLKWYVGGNRTDRLRAADYQNHGGTIDPLTGDTSHVWQDGDRAMQFFNNALKAGIDLELNDKNSIGLEIQGGQSGRNFPSELTNTEWTTGDLTKVVSTSDALTEARSIFGSATLNQFSQFGDDKNHKLESSLFVQYEDGDENTASDKFDELGNNVSWQKSWEDNNSKEIRFKTDYTRPWKSGKIEAGYQLRLDDNWADYRAEFDTVIDNSKFDNETNFYRLINGGYLTFSGEYKKLGYQAGLRGEHTFRQFENTATDSTYELNRMDWYPTIHLSYEMRAEQSLMASYTRRIDRPRSYYLDPNPVWRDPNNVRQGDPSLLPQYINSYEVSYQKRFGYNFVSVELFHRNVKNKIERVPGRYEDYDGVFLRTQANVGEDFSTGAEAMLNYNLNKWWMINLSASAYDYRMQLDPAFESSLNETQSFNWRSRLSNTFKPTQTMRVQFDAMYNGPSVTATGTRSAMAFTSLAVKQSFFNRKLDASVSVFDIFNTAKMKMESSGETFYTNYHFDMKSPNITFTLSYRFNNYKPEKQQRGEGGGMDMEF